MNFPLDRPFFQFLYWVGNTPGMGGVAVSLIVISFVGLVGGALRWISKGAEVEELETYAYPTTALHDHS